MNMPCIEAASSMVRRTRRQMVPRTLFYLLLLLPSVSPVAEPKGFTEDPYVDDEKFREKGWIHLLVIITIIIMKSFANLQIHS